MIAAAHLGICWPESVVEWLEYPCYSSPRSAGMYPFPLAAEILKDPLQIDHGDLIVPREPGLGVHGGRVGDRALSLDSRAVVAVPHRFSGRNPRRHLGPQRQVGRQIGVKEPRPLPLLRSAGAYFRRDPADLQPDRPEDHRPGRFRISGAQVLFPITYIFGDVFTEVYGYAASRRAIWIGFMASALLAVLGLFAVWLPPAPGVAEPGCFRGRLRLCAPHDRGQPDGLLVRRIRQFLCAG